MAANASAYQVTGGEWASGTIQWSNKPAADAFFKAGVDGEGVGKANGGTDDPHIQKVMYIPQAEFETIYSPQIHYDYEPEDVQIVEQWIKDQNV